jgi:hypothetical protein
VSDEPGAVEPQPAPYIIEGARSSRSRCKTCRRKIDKGALRIGILIEGPYGMGYLWHHLRCAARRQFERVEEAYALEAWNEAKDPPKNVPPLEELRKHGEEAEQRRRERKPIPHVELAPSGRSKCKQCDRAIEKGSPRVVLGRGVEFGNQIRVGPINVHPRCVAEALRAVDSATEVEGFEQALHENSGDFPREVLDAVIAEIGALDGPEST